MDNKKYARWRQLKNMSNEKCNVVCDCKGCAERRKLAIELDVPRGALDARANYDRQ